MTKTKHETSADEDSFTESSVDLSSEELDEMQTSSEISEYGINLPSTLTLKPKIWCDDVITASSTGRNISSIKFKQFTRTTLMSEEVCESIKDVFAEAKNWEAIPSFSIITGKNGQGKSLLLKYIYHTITESPNGLRENTLFDKGEVLYIGSDHEWDNKVSQNSKGSNAWNFSAHEREQWLPQVKKYFETLNPADLRSSFATRVVTTLTQSKLPEDLRDYNPTDAEINSAAAGTIDYEINDLKISTPVAFLEQVFKEYKSRFDLNQSSSTQIDGALRVFDHYTKLPIKCTDALGTASRLELRPFLELFMHDIDFRTKLIEDFIYEIMGSPPWEEFNDILKKYNFKYSIGFETTASAKYEYKIVFKREYASAKPIKPESLSSGEKLILNLLSWSYYVKGLKSDEIGSYSKLDNKVKIMLLDEFDSHFDPKWCKLFLDVIKHEFVEKSKIQVMIATHRIDTVALAPKDSIFVIKNTCGHAEIIDCHPLQAMFRMTSNLRDITNYHHKVYAESLNDAYFYESFYNSLMIYCSAIRHKARAAAEEVDEKPDYYWYIQNEPFRILSERCQLSFYSVSTIENDGGGCQEVIKAVKRDQNLHKSSTKGYFNEPALHRTYGILDSDYHKEHKLEEFSTQITNLKRHSLENFLYDPFILASIDNIKNDNIQNLKQLISNTEVDVDIEAVQYVVTKYFTELFEKMTVPQLSKDYETILSRVSNPNKVIKLNNAKSKDEIYKAETSELVKKIFDLIDSLDLSEFTPQNMVYNPHYEVKKLKYLVQQAIETSKVVDQKIKDSIINKLYDIVEPLPIVHHCIISKQKDIFILGSKTIPIILSTEKIIHVQYPGLFLEWQGHDLACVKLHVSKENLVEQIAQCDKLSIPLDLAEVFFTLNKEVVSHVRKVIGKGAMPAPLKHVENSIEAEYDDVNCVDDYSYMRNIRDISDGVDHEALMGELLQIYKI